MIVWHVSGRLTAVLRPFPGRKLTDFSMQCAAKLIISAVAKAFFFFNYAEAQVYSLRCKLDKSIRYI